MPTDFLTPVGRLVQGSVLEAQTKDNKGQPLTVKTGPNKGQPTQRFFMAIAIPKNDPNWPALHSIIYNEGKTGYPQLFTGPGGACTHPRFAFKIMDGDGVDNDGKPNNTKEGFAGHWVLKFSSSYAPKVYDTSGNQITDVSAIKRGYYVRVSGNVAPNIGSDVPGVYLNHNGVEFVAYGPEITSGPDVASLFRAAGPATLPPGATLAPPTAATSALPAPGGATPPPLAPVAAVPPPGLLPPGAAAPAPLAPPPLAAPAPVAPPPLAAPAPAAQPTVAPQYASQGHTVATIVAHCGSVEAGIAQGYLMAPVAPAALPTPGVLPPPQAGFVAAAVAAAAPPTVAPHLAAQGHTLQSIVAHCGSVEAAVAQGFLIAG